MEHLYATTLFYYFYICYNNVNKKGTEWLLILSIFVIASYIFAYGGRATVVV